MTYIFMTAGSICLLYFIILALRKVDFCVIWLAAAIFFGMLSAYLHYRGAHPDGFRLPKTAAAAAGAVILCAALLFLALETRIICTMWEKPEAGCEYIIVLGAQVKKTTPSKALRRRLEAAEKYLKENKETIAVLSGGQGDGEEISEAQCMFEYLSAAGIEKERMILEDQSTTTGENLRFSAKKIAEKEGLTSLEEIYSKKIGLLSNNFHLYRAKLLAEKTGYRQVSVIAARSDWKLQVHYLVREFFALIKEKISGQI